MAGKNRSVFILKNTLSNYVRQGVQIAVFLVLTPFVASRLGTEGFGLWALLQAVIGLFGLFDLGFGTSVVKYVADARGKQDDRRLANLVSTFFWVYMVLGAAVMGAAALFSLFLPELLNIPEAYEDASRMVFLLVAFRTAVGMPLGMFAGVMTGFQRQWWANMFKTASTLLYAAGAFWALTVQPSVEFLALANLISHTAAMGVGALVCIRVLPGVSIRLREARLSMVREVSSFSMYIFIIQVSTLIYTRVDSLIVQSFLSLSAVALYSVAARVAEEASGLCRQLTNALTPVIAELHGSGENQNIREVFRLGTKLSTALAVPLLTGLAFLAEPLLSVWMGESFREAAPAAQILLAAMMVSVIHGNAANVLSMTGHQRYLSRVFFGGQLLNLGLTLLLIRSLGLPGAALATLISTSCTDIILVQPKAGKTTGIRNGYFYGSAVLPSLLPLGIMAAALAGAVRIIPPDSLAAIALLEFIACLVFFTAFFFIGLTGRERSYLLSRLKRNRVSEDD